MRFIRLIGLVVLAALAISAIAAAGTAAAKPKTVVCKANENRCSQHNSTSGFLAVVVNSAEKPFTHAYFTFAGGSEVQCHKSEMTVTGESVEAVSALSFGECGGECESVSAQNLPYAASLEATTKPNGKVTLSSGGSGEPRLAFKCGSAECVYGASSIVFELTAGTPATLASSSGMTKKSGSTLFCPTSLTLNDTHKLTEPSSAYVGPETVLPAKGVQVICETNPEGKECPEGFERGLDFALELIPKTELVISPWLPGPCTGSRIGVQSSEEPAGLEGTIYQFSLSGCTGGACHVSMQNLPYEIELQKAESGNGTFVLGEGSEPILNFDSCIGFKCSYTMTEAVIEFIGGNPAQASFTATLVYHSGSPCQQGKQSMTGYYMAVEPAAPLYVAKN